MMITAANRSWVCAAMLLLSYGCLPTSKHLAPEAIEDGHGATSGLPPLLPPTTPAPNPPLSDTPDFDALRDAYGRRSDYFVRCERDRPTDKFMEAVDRNDFASAVAAGVDFLQLCPVDAKFHILVATALFKQGKSAEAQHHQRWFVGLTDSVLKTGNGRSPETAYVTISIAEEYAVLLRMGLQAESQALLEQPFQVDVISARGEDGKTSAIYFNPLWHFIRLASGADG